MQTFRISCFWFKINFCVMSNSVLSASKLVFPVGNQNSRCDLLQDESLLSSLLTLITPISVHWPFGPASGRLQDDPTTFEHSWSLSQCIDNRRPEDCGGATLPLWVDSVLRAPVSQCLNADSSLVPISLNLECHLCATLENSTMSFRPCLAQDFSALVRSEFQTNLQFSRLYDVPKSNVEDCFRAQTSWYQSSWLWFLPPEALLLTFFGVLIERKMAARKHREIHDVETNEEDGPTHHAWPYL